MKEGVRLAPPIPLSQSDLLHNQPPVAVSKYRAEPPSPYYTLGLLKLVKGFAEPAPSRKLPGERRNKKEQARTCSFFAFIYLLGAIA